MYWSEIRNSNHLVQSRSPGMKPGRIDICILGNELDNTTERCRVTNLVPDAALSTQLGHHAPVDQGCDLQGMFAGHKMLTASEWRSRIGLVVMLSYLTVVSESSSVNFYRGNQVWG
jgi:hypothetical protein